MAKEQQTGIFSNFGLLIVGLLVGAVAVILLNIHISNIRRQHEMDAIQVLQLTQDVKVGDKVTSRHIRTVDIPADFKEGFKGAIEAKLKFSIIDRRARKDMDRGKILLNADFDEDVMEAGTAIKVPKGYSL
ncbi:MAG: hypothetical protein QF662_05445, partial [Phycisphaerae bacterium]|nr:hypothetical protein [Phycisphaerae bacterium]